MAAALALVAAFLFALAATLQQKGALNLPSVSLAEPSSLLKLLGQTMWVLGTTAMLIGYVVQAAALDRGQVSIVQPLLVTTVVFALPLGHYLTQQHVGRREIGGAFVIIVGLVLFTVFGHPADGNENAPGSSWLFVIVLVAIVSGVVLSFAGRSGPSMKAALYGSVAGVLFGLSASLTKPTLDYLEGGVGEMLSHWEPYVARGRRDPRIRDPTDLARHRPPGAVGGDRVDRQPGRVDPDRHVPPRRTPEPADLARGRGDRRADPRPRRSGGDLDGDRRRGRTNPARAPPARQRDRRRRPPDRRR